MRIVNKRPEPGAARKAYGPIVEARVAEMCPDHTVAEIAAEMGMLEDTARTMLRRLGLTAKAARAPKQPKVSRAMPEKRAPLAAKSQESMSILEASQARWAS